MRTTSFQKVCDVDPYQNFVAPKAGALQLFIDPSLVWSGRPSFWPRICEVACRATQVLPP